MPALIDRKIDKQMLDGSIDRFQMDRQINVGSIDRCMLDRKIDRFQMDRQIDFRQIDRQMLDGWIDCICTWLDIYQKLLCFSGKLLAFKCCFEATIYLI